jgi:hypothetical protein
MYTMRSPDEAKQAELLEFVQPTPTMRRKVRSQPPASHPHLAAPSMQIWGHTFQWHFSLGDA